MDENQLPKQSFRCGVGNAAPPSAYLVQTRQTPYPHSACHLRRGRGNTEYDRFTCDVTLIEEETIEAMKRQEPPVDSGDSARRNIVVRNCSLALLIGRTFR